MATGRDYLQSIIAQAARLQSMSDDVLEHVSEGLARVDNELVECLDYLGE